MPRRVSPEDRCIGFALNHLWTPHFCKALLQDGEGNRFVKHDLDREALAVPLSERQVEVMRDQYLFLDGAACDAINETYTMTQGFEVFYTGSDACDGFTFGPSPLRLDQFAYGTHGDVIQQIENVHWTRLNRCVVDAAKFYDELKDPEKKKALLRQQMASFEKRNMTYDSHYQTLRQKLKGLEP